MNTYFELWDAESGNLLGDFDTLDDATTYLRSLFDERGPSVLSGLFLLGDAEESEPIADDELLRVVREHGALTPVPL